MIEINTSIRVLAASDWPAVRTIYEAGIATGVATFETQTPEWAAWDAGHRADCRLAAVRDGQVIGWAALSPVSKRVVYAGVAEVGIYVAPAFQRQGVGTQILQALIMASEEAGIWTLQSRIIAANTASLRLHVGCGFREVGIQERIGKLHGVWHDTIMLERRSSRVGL